LAVLRGDDESLTPRARALARLAVTLTAEPWALTEDAVDDARGHALDEEQIEAAVGVICMFNYFTRVADATGVEFDYLTPLPAFKPDLERTGTLQPRQSASPRSDAGASRPRPRHRQLRTAWESWRAYALESDGPISPRERRLLAMVAAQEAGEGAGSETLTGLRPLHDGDDRLAGFARKLSREPWRMEAGDLESLRALGYSEEGVLHVISVVSHQNADSRLVIGLRAAGRS
jgi:hypothetical protein